MAPEPRRQRANGTWTTTTVEWDARWYWPVGTRVRLGLALGRVVKENGVSVRVLFDSGPPDALISKIHPQLARVDA